MKTCCFIGHRIVNVNKVLKDCVSVIVKYLIFIGYDTFLFGSRSQFTDMCYEAVTQEMERHPNIQRVYVRAEYPYIDKDYTDYLLQYYEKTYYDDRLLKCGKAAYLIRDRLMIDKSEWCVFYFDKNYESTLKGKHSGTRLAYTYAKMLNKHTSNLFPDY